MGEKKGPASRAQEEWSGKRCACCSGRARQAGCGDHHELSRHVVGGVGHQRGVVLAVGHLVQRGHQAQRLDQRQASGEATDTGFVGGEEGGGDPFPVQGGEEGVAHELVSERDEPPKEACGWSSARRCATRPPRSWPATA